jgi:multiple sugar transport system ATP-binding protein
MNLFTGAEAEKHDAKTIGVRPEHMLVSKTEGLWKGRVGVAEHLGSDTFIHVHDTGLAEMVTVRISGDLDVRHGDTIYLSPDMEKMHRFDANDQRIA